MSLLHRRLGFNNSRHTSSLATNTTNTMQLKSISVKKSSDLNHTYFHVFQFILRCKASYIAKVMKPEIAEAWRSCYLFD